MILIFICLHPIIKLYKVKLNELQNTHYWIRANKLSISYVAATVLRRPEPPEWRAESMTPGATAIE